MSDNPIPIGLSWTQAFDFPAGFLQAGDAIRCEIRQFATDRLPITSITAGQGTQIDGDRVFLSLNKAQTALMKAGTVRTMPLLVRGGQEVFLDILIEIPVVVPVTRGTP